MKAVAYVKRYNLKNENRRFNQTQFCDDFENDFISLLEQTPSGKKDYRTFHRLVDQLRGKWLGINLKIQKELPEKIWSYLYASRIMPIRDKFFPELKKNETQSKEIVNR